MKDQYFKEKESSTPGSDIFLKLVYFSSTLNVFIQNQIVLGKMSVCNKSVVIKY